MSKRSLWPALTGLPLRLPRWIALGLLHVYRSCISPLFPSCCRFQPSCSAYALHAITRYGLLKGGLLAIKRLGRCHPWARAGYDPVPELTQKKETV